MMKYIKLFSFCLIYVKLLQDGCHSTELVSSTESDNFNASINDKLRHYTDYPLHKCHCGANQFWHHSECHQANTSVDVITNYDPFEIKKVETIKFDEVLISNVSCAENETVIDIQRGLLSYGKVMHLGSGDQFKNYCVENIQDKSGDIVMVSSVCMPQILPLPLCCEESKVFDDESMSCQNGEPKPFDLPIKLGTDNLNGPKVEFYTQNIPNKIIRGKILLSNDSLWSLNYRWYGRIYLKEGETHAMEREFDYALPDEFCVILKSSKALDYSAYIWEEESVFHDNNELCEKTMHWILIPLIIISIIFLVAILVLYMILPNLRKSTGNKITICHMSSLLAGFCVLIILHIPQNHECKIYGPLIQISFLSMFFWLNIMCFDLWWKLRWQSPAPGERNRSSKRFILYSIYAWGGPLLIGAVTIAMDNIPALQKMEGLILPGFGKGGHCWFADRTATYVYYFGIIAALMTLNVFFFLWVFVILVNANCVYSQVLNSNSADNKRLWIYLKIFCLMGVTWICEFFSWQEGTCMIWIATDIINALRGLILFIIFFGNRNSANKIRERVSSLNASLSTRLSRSMTNLRKLSLTLESAIDSRRSSEVVSPADLPNRSSNNFQEGQFKLSDLQDSKRKRNPSCPIIVNVETRRESSASSPVQSKPPSCPALICPTKPDAAQGEPMSEKKNESRDPNKKSAEFYI